MASLLSYTKMATGISAYPTIPLFIIEDFRRAVKFSKHRQDRARREVQIEKVRLKRPTAARVSSSETERAVWFPLEGRKWGLLFLLLIPLA